jgi:hypothetical protein
MKQSFLLCVFACLFFVFSACNKKKDATPFLSIDPATALLDSTIGPATSFTVSSNIEWKLSVSPASASGWLQLDKTSGENTSVVQLTVIGKNNAAGQNVVITASPANGSNTPSATFTVSQNGFFNVDKQSLSIDAAAGSYDSFTVVTNMQWRITAVPYWIKLDTALQAAGKMVVKMNASEDNLTGAKRDGFITLTPISSNNSVQPVKLSVSQQLNWGIQRYSPAEGPVGTEVTLYGVFGANPAVYISDIKCNIISTSGNKIIVTIPSNAVGGKFMVKFDNNHILYSAPTAFTLRNGWNIRGRYTYDRNYAVNGITFTHNGSIYFGLGTGIADYTPAGTNAIFKLDTSTFTWSQVTTLPSDMQPRRYPFCFILNNKVYIGGGSNGLHDVWEYDPGNSTWRKMASIPDNGMQTMAFTAGNIAWVQSAGSPRHFSGSSMFTFTVSGPDDPGTWLFDANIDVTQNYTSSFTIDGKIGYFGGGYDMTSAAFPTKFYRYDPLLPGVVAMQSLPKPAVTGQVKAPAFTVGNKGYILCQYKDLYEYDAATNTWTLVSTIPGGNTMYFAAAIGNRIFAWTSMGNIIEYVR